MRNLIISFLSKPLFIYLLICLLYFCLFTFKSIYLKKTVYGDGRYYYTYLRSAVIDHDLQFSNEYTYFHIVEPITKLGFQKNVYAIGPALFWFPAFLFIHNLIAGDGYSFIYQYFIGLNSVMYVLIGILLIYKIFDKLKKPIFTSLTLIALAFGTNLLFYGSLDPVNSHSISFFVASILLTLLIQKQHPFLIGGVVGLLALIRSQDIIFISLLLPYFSNVIMAIPATIIFIIPQLYTWQYMYGTFLTSPYLSPYHYFDFYHPQILNVLFSSQNGLLLYTPLVGVALFGLLFYKKSGFLQKITIILLFLLQLYLIASWSFWWQGESYSGRMFISILPFLTLGFFAFFNKFTLKISISLVFLGSIINVFTILLFLLHN